jgi:uncharacterized protein YcaQ
VTLTRAEARRFLLTVQGLLPGRQLAGEQAIQTVFHQRRLIQFDPLNPCGRNTDLVLQARISDYRRGDYFKWAYEKRQGVDGYDKVLCILPIEDWPYLRFAGAQMSAARLAFVHEHAVDLDRVITTTLEHGPVTSDGIQDDRRSDIGWYGESAWGKVALETLWRMQRLVVTRRPDGRKVYDLPFRVYGDLLPKDDVTFGAHVLRRVQSVGLLPATGSGTGWLGMGSVKQIKQEIDALVQSASLVRLDVEGVRGSYVARAEDMHFLEAQADATDAMLFLAPLDNVLWDRDMIEALFGFYYRWEVYVPPSKRKYGYYVLPIVQGDRLVGRIEPVLRDGLVQIKGLWWEEGVDVVRARRQLEVAIDHFCLYLTADLMAEVTGMAEKMDQI